MNNSIIIAYAKNEKGGNIVADLISKALTSDIELYLSVINWGEIYYITLRTQGKEKTELFKTTLARFPVTIVDADKELTAHAAELKAFNKISYADAFAAALSKIKKAVLVTGDKEFQALEKEIKISWI